MLLMWSRYILYIFKSIIVLLNVRPVTGLVEIIYIMLYEEESKGLDSLRGYLQDSPRAIT